MVFANPFTLIVVAAVANLPLAMANVALPSIGDYFDASQIQLHDAPRSSERARPYVARTYTRASSLGSKMT